MTDIAAKRHIEAKAKDRRIKELEAQLENERVRGIYSCGPHCHKLECKQRREIERLRGAMRKAQNETGTSTSTWHILKAALKGDVVMGELNEHHACAYASYCPECRVDEQDKTIERLRKELDELREFTKYG